MKVAKAQGSRSTLCTRSWQMVTPSEEEPLALYSGVSHSLFVTYLPYQVKLPKFLPGIALFQEISSSVGVTCLYLLLTLPHLSQIPALS